LVKDLKELDSYPYVGHSVILNKKKNGWQDVEYVLALFGSRKATARRQYRAYVEEGIAQGRRPDLVGGGLIRSLGGWEKIKALRKKDIRLKGDERILGDTDFVLAVLEMKGSLEIPTLCWRYLRKVKRDWSGDMN
jgi:hypothetical protein